MHMATHLICVGPLEYFFDQLGQPIRLLMKYNELEFDNVMYEQGDGKLQ